MAWDALPGIDGTPRAGWFRVAGVSYILDKEQEEARKRLELLARIEDPGSIVHLSRLGILSGFRCLEVGAGAGTIAVWLADRVAPDGIVVATDIDTTFLEPLRSDRLEVWEHDVVADALEHDAFDIVHTRNVLVHLPERESVLERLSEAVKPGGWLLVEELDRITDGPDPTSPEEMRALYRTVIDEIYSFVTSMGIDPSFGARVFGSLRRLGWKELGAEGRSHVFRGNSEEPVSAHVAAFAELKGPIVERGKITSLQFDDFLALTRDPDFAWREGLTIATWARKPAED
jgi:ubiquinone/menaquinone biosynthesis C-methylase UbiE